MPPHRRVAPAVRSSAYAAIRGSRLLTFQRPLCAARIGFLQSVQKRTFGSCRSTALSGFGRRPDRVDERRECRRYLTSPRVIEEKSGKRRTQILVYSRERPVLEQRSNLVLDDVREAHTIILISRATRATRRCCNPPSSLAAIANHLRGQLDGQADNQFGQRPVPGRRHGYCDECRQRPGTNASLESGDPAFFARRA